uniref:NR LBD domain-containing protein n=1 Tax=Acrobeloides nanus TaxID=290746 RepID=A0A914EGJ4_9BILA
MVALAKMLMYTEKFAGLKFSDKILMFKNAWTQCYQVERAYTTVLSFGTSPTDFRAMYTQNTAIDFADLKNYRFKDIDSVEYDEMIRFWFPIMEKIIRSLLLPVKSLELTQFEASYLIAQILWSIQGDK